MSRRDIYYWKCDRPAAFHGTQTRGESRAELESQVREELRRHFDSKAVELSPGAGQGNHLTWTAEVDGRPMFVRVENGPENDGHLAIESVLLDRVREVGVRTPRVFGCDAARSRVSFAWQALERIAAPDLNHWFKQGTLEVPSIAFEIGRAVAKWQAITPEGFGVIEWSAKAIVRNEDQATPKPHRGLCGPHSAYADYFHLRLEEHLRILTARGFLANADEILAEIENHRALLDLPQGCLVHKDLALWNILGTRDQIAAFIDFDDTISGDPMDDLSLLACFHDKAFLRRVFEGYQNVRTLPEHHLRRLWLHLLRNMIVKAVIRLGSGFFDCDDGHFLIAGGSSGREFRDFTCQRLFKALQCLRENADIDSL